MPTLTSIQQNLPGIKLYFYIFYINNYSILRRRKQRLFYKYLIQSGCRAFPT